MFPEAPHEAPPSLPEGSAGDIGAGLEGSSRGILSRGTATIQLRCLFRATYLVFTDEDSGKGGIPKRCCSFSGRPRQRELTGLSPAQSRTQSILNSFPESTGWWVREGGMTPNSCPLFV